MKEVKITSSVANAFPYTDEKGKTKYLRLAAGENSINASIWKRCVDQYGSSVEKSKELGIISFGDAKPEVKADEGGKVDMREVVKKARDTLKRKPK